MLFWVFESFEEKLKFVRSELFATLAVELLSEGVELLAKEDVLGSQLFVFRNETRLFVGSFDEISLASFFQTTR